jgi:sugar O-acyltransferase (sialic acid O-acetyltransferase NeuD family)
MGLHGYDTQARPPLVIFGTGGFGREVHELVEDVLEAAALQSVLHGFLDGDPAMHGQRVHGLPVLGGIDWVRANPGAAVLIGIGSPVVKRRISSQLRAAGATFPTVVHPGAVVGRRVALGEGNIVTAGCIMTTDAQTAEFVTFNLGVTFTHDSTIGAYTNIAPYALLSGNFTCGEGVDIGTGATVLQGMTVGDWAIIGGGALVNREVPANTTVVGVPAKVIKERPAGWHES